MDEPFGSLDALTREKMGDELLTIWQKQRKTVLMVTHSIGEALLLADRVVLFSQRPGTVILDMKVDLNRPRSEEMRYSHKFGRLAEKLRSEIRNVGL
jgi:NitT/TauT family transport system ATP-binding protein